MKGAARWSVALALVVAASACVSSRSVERADWGAVPEDERIRVTRVDGSQQELTGVVVYEDAVAGVDRRTGESVSIPLDRIELIEVRSPAMLRTALGVVAVGGAIAIIAALGESDVRPEPVVSSCPFVYSFDGSGYRLDSETYAGAVARGLERTDVDNLEHLVAVEGVFRLLLTNERPETQYTDQLSLLAVDHRAGTVVLPDRDGRLYALDGLQPPLAASALHGGDALAAVSRADGEEWLGAPPEHANADVDAELRDGLLLAFPRPRGTTARLAVTSRNTVLAPFALRTFLELQGDSLGAWYHRVARDPELRRGLAGWMAREGTLHVYVDVDGEWVLQDALPDVGPYVAKTQVARLDLEAVRGDTVRVRLEWARGLWTLDQLALGAEAPDGIVAQRRLPLRVVAATSPTGQEPLPAAARARLERRLTEVDGDWHTALPYDTLRLEATAPAPPPTGASRSLVIRSHGHYNLHTHHRGAPRAAVADRILSEPLFGNRYLLGEWLRRGGPRWLPATPGVRSRAPASPHPPLSGGAMKEEESPPPRGARALRSGVGEDAGWAREAERRQAPPSVGFPPEASRAAPACPGSAPARPPGAAAWPGRGSGAERSGSRRAA